MSLRTGASAATVLRLESLEAREVPAIAIQVDYSLDLRANGGSGFFEDHADARTVMNRVAQEMSQRVSANLSAINPSGSNTWDALFYNPETGTTTSVRNVHVAANTLVVFVGMRAMPGGEAGQGGFGGYSWSGTSAWGDRLLHRGSSGFTPWGGSIGFDSTENWHFGLTTSGLASNELDFYSVATHELGHLLGIGTSNQWFSHVQNGKFTGSYAESVYGGPVPLDPSGAHWADGILNNGQPVSLDPTLNYGVRVTWTSLDEAGLRDVGWGAGSPPSPPVSPPPAVPPTLPPVGSQTRLPVLVAGPNGRVDVYARGNDGTLTFSGTSFTPFAGFNGTVRTAVADFNGDGIADYAFGTGAGTAAQVRIINGATGTDLLSATQVLGGFGGGINLAAGDVNRDGKAELVVGADAGGLPVVKVFRVDGGNLAAMTSFLAFSANSRRGVRVAMGDINHDGAADLVVGAGAGQLPRVLIYDGNGLAAGSAALLSPAFLAFATRMTAGVNLAIGDINGDGFGELIVSQDVGGSSKVRVWSGAAIAGSLSTPISALSNYQTFFANGLDDRGGIRVVSRDIDGDGRAELVTSTASSDAGWVRVLSVSSTDVTAQAAIFPFSGRSVVAG